MGWLLTALEVPVFKFPHETDEPWWGVVPLKHGDLIGGGGEGRKLRVLHTPGHTDDHISLFCEATGRLWCGDNMLGWGSTTFERLGPYMKSLRSYLDLKPVASGG